MVLFYDNPQNPSDPCVGWVSRRPGVNTVYILTFSPDTGFVEKPSVRHADDPGLLVGLLAVPPGNRGSQASEHAYAAGCSGSGPKQQEGGLTP
jgi:hypothetical protein